MGEKRSYSRETRLKAERLYLAKGMSPAEIAEELGITAQSVSNLAHKHGWAAKRREKESRALARAEDKAAAEATEFLESVTPQAMEAAEKGFQMARDTRDAKDFAMAMKGTQIAVQIARQGLGLDGANAASAGRADALSLVYMRFSEAPKPAEKAAQPIDVSATEKQADEMTLDFEQSQQGSERCAESAALIENRAQVVENRRAS